MTSITGATRLIGILADPIAHVTTPAVLNARFARDGTDAVIVPMHVGADSLPQALEGLRQVRNLAGLVITVPHKVAVTRLCDELLPTARRVGAANAIHRLPDGRLVGEMFDGLGFVEGLRGRGRDPRGAAALLLGAGGAASAIAFALAEAGVSRLSIANRSRDKAERLAAEVAAAYPALEIRAAEPDPSGHNRVINATSLGLNAADSAPLDVNLLTPAMTVAEVIMKPARTRLLEEAAARGCSTHEGLHMLEAQIDLLARFTLEGS